MIKIITSCSPESLFFMIVKMGLIPALGLKIPGIFRAELSGIYGKVWKITGIKYDSVIGRKKKIQKKLVPYYKQNCL